MDEPRYNGLNDADLEAMHAQYESDRARASIRRALSGDHEPSLMSTMSPEDYAKEQAAIREQNQAIRATGEAARPAVYRTPAGGLIGVRREFQGRTEAAEERAAGLNRVFQSLLDAARLSNHAVFEILQRDTDPLDGVKMTVYPNHYIIVDDIQIEPGTASPVDFQALRSSALHDAYYQAIQQHDEDPIDDAELRGPQTGSARKRQLQISRGEKYGPPRSRNAGRRR